MLQLYEFIVLIGISRAQFLYIYNSSLLTTFDIDKDIIAIFSPIHKQTIQAELLHQPKGLRGAP